MLNVLRCLLSWPFSAPLFLLLALGWLDTALAQPASEPPSQAWRGLSAPPAPAAESPPSAPPPAPAPAPASPPPAPTVASPTTTDDAVRLSPPPPPVHGRRSEAGPPVAADDTSVAEDEHSPMPWLGMSVKVGFATVNSGVLDNPTYSPGLAAVAAMRPREELEAAGLVSEGACTPIDQKCRTSARSGFQLALALHVGGDGFGWDAEPYVTIGGNAVAVGVYTGPKFDIHAADDLYVGFGFGAKLAYVALEHWKHGGDVFGRIPVHATYYLSENFALTVEGAFGAGVSLFVSEPIRYVDIRTGRALATAPKIGFGAARSWDLTLGVRFP